MGYYDFNDHFWAPQEVCAQLLRQKAPQRVFGFRSLMEILRGVFLHQRTQTPTR
jgi:hypothetical protein